MFLFRGSFWFFCDICCFLDSKHFLNSSIQEIRMSDNKSVSSDSSEPYLNYTRLQDDIEKVCVFVKIFNHQQAETEVYTSIAIHDRYTALGTNSGKILLFSNKNKLFKIFKQHIGKINAISIDKVGNTIASAGEDGYVYVQSLSDNTRYPHKYTTAVRVATFRFS